MDKINRVKCHIRPNLLKQLKAEVIFDPFFQELSDRIKSFCQEVLQEISGRNEKECNVPTTQSMENAITKRNMPSLISDALQLLQKKLADDVAQLRFRANAFFELKEIPKEDQQEIKTMLEKSGIVRQNRWFINDTNKQNLYLGKHEQYRSDLDLFLDYVKKKQEEQALAADEILDDYVKSFTSQCEAVLNAKAFT